MGFRTLCFETNCKCTYEGGYLVRTTAKDTVKFHLSEVESVVFGTPQVYVSAYLLTQLAAHKIPVVFCDDRYLPSAELLSLNGAHNSAECLKRQLAWAPVPKKQVWQGIVQQKNRRQAELLRLFGDESTATVLDGYARDVHSGDSTNREAAAACTYFNALFGSEFNRDLPIRTNAKLDFGYSIILSRIAREIVSQGCLIQLGIFHRGATNGFNLACDFMEPFRPLVDRIVVGSVEEELAPPLKHRFIDLGNRTVKYRDGDYKVSSVMRSYVRQCIDALNGEIGASEIEVYSIA